MEYRLGVKSIAFMVVIGGLITSISAWEYHGHELIARAQCLTTQGRRSMVDPSVALSEGYLQDFLLYVHPLPDGVSVPPLQLQVWTTTQQPSSYMLKWEMDANFTEGSDRQYEFPVPPNEHIYITPSDRLGVTSSEDLNPITYDFVQGSQVKLRRTQAGRPERGNTYEFDPIPYPAVFSIGVRVTQEVPAMEGPLAYFGNGLIQRGSGLTTDSLTRAWVDDNVVPSSGNLVAYHLYAGDLGSHRPSIRLQIWTKVEDMEGKMYSLKWERRVELTQGGLQIYKFDVLESESIHLTASDRIGWTFDDELGPVASSFSASHQSYMLELHDEFPRVGDTCQFDGLPMPVVFSVGITLDTEGDPIVGTVQGSAEAEVHSNRQDTFFLEQELWGLTGAAHRPVGERTLPMLLLLPLMMHLCW